MRVLSPFRVQFRSVVRRVPGGTGSDVDSNDGLSLQSSFLLSCLVNLYYFGNRVTTGNKYVIVQNRQLEPTPQEVGRRLVRYS